MSADAKSKWRRRRVAALGTVTLAMLSVLGVGPVARADEALPATSPEPTAGTADGAAPVPSEDVPLEAAPESSAVAPSPAASPVPSQEAVPDGSTGDAADHVPVPAQPQPTPSPEMVPTPVPDTPPAPEAEVEPEPATPPSGTREPSPTSTPAAEDSVDEPATATPTHAWTDPDAATLAVDPSRETEFIDVAADVEDAAYSAHAESVAWVAGTGIATGWPSDQGRVFRPDDPVTRAVAAAMLHAFAGSPSIDPPAESPFIDTSSLDSVYYPEITWAALHGLARGWASDTSAEFRPVDAVTRAHAALMLHRFAGAAALDDVGAEASPFVDVATTDTAFAAIAWLEAVGVVRGHEGDDGREFRPADPITRAEFAALLHRFELTGRAADAPVRRAITVRVDGVGSIALRSDATADAHAAIVVAEGDTLVTTGARAVDGWVEVFAEGARLWAPGEFLLPGAGASLAEVQGSYDNGALPAEVLCALPWAGSVLVLCDAATDLTVLNAAFRARFESDIPLTGGYRDLAGQVAARAAYGDQAALPGTSMHGWGAAIDLDGARLPGGYDGAAYAWLTERGPAYGWHLPTWARPDGPKPEPWHLEYGG